MFQEVVLPVLLILLLVFGGILIYAAMMALTLTGKDGDADVEPPESGWTLWFDMLIPVYSTSHSIRNLRRNWWTMRGPSILVIVGFALLLLALLLWKFS